MVKAEWSGSYPCLCTGEWTLMVDGKDVSTLIPDDLKTSSMNTDGTKIELVQPMGAFDNIGEVCEVVKVTEDGVISFKFGNGRHLGCMSFNEYEKYFKPYEAQVPVKREWSTWESTYIGYTNMNDETVKERIEYRDNELKIQVRTTWKDDNLKARSSCCKTDLYDKEKGLNLAISRLILKLLTREVDKMAKNM